MTNLLAILLSLLTGTAQDLGQVPASGPISEANHSTIGYPTTAAALEALRKSPNAKFSERDGWTIVQEQEPGKEGFALWSFTPAGHPAHPAVAKRTVFERDGSVWVDLNVHCEATKEPCDQFVRDFQQLNERMKRSVGSKQ